MRISTPGVSLSYFGTRKYNTYLFDLSNVENQIRWWG